MAGFKDWFSGGQRGRGAERPVAPEHAATQARAAAPAASSTPETPVPTATSLPDRATTATRVRSFDVWAHQDRLADTLSGVLDQAGVEHARLPRGSAAQPTLVLAAPSLPDALAALAAAADADTWWAVMERKAGPEPAQPLGSVTSTRGVRAITVFANLAAPNGTLLTDESTGVALEPWRVVQTPDRLRRDGGNHLVGTLLAVRKNRVVEYLEPPAWAEAQQSPTRWPAYRQLPHLLDVTEPVDLVYTWVDGADPAWLERKLAAQRRIAGAGHHEGAFTASRFADHDELRYSLRSVEMYANWVQHIWLVTDGQVPAWLRREHPKLTVVDHREIFADPSALPVFNSHAIESQLHHIEGLAELFLYVNDDVFFGRPVRPELFFHGNGIAKLFVSGALLTPEGFSDRDQPVLTAAKRSRELIEREFGRTFTAKVQHTHLPQRRSLLYELEARYPDIFDRVMRSTFRHPDDYAIPSSLAQYYAYATGRAVTGQVSYGYLDISVPSAAAKLAAWVHTHPFECLCLNDTDGELPPEERDAMIRTFLAGHFPVPSSFEADIPEDDA